MTTISPEFTEQEMTLAKRLAAGQSQALDEFYGLYASDLYAFIYHSVDCNTFEAEDIWQDTLIAAINGISAYRGDSHIFTWLCAIARLKISDYYRKQGRRDQKMGREINIETAEIISDLKFLPEALLSQKEIRLRVIKTLQDLPEDYRLALLGRYLEEKDVKKLSALTGKSYKATESLLSRAREKFKNLFKQSGDENA